MQEPAKEDADTIEGFEKLRERVIDRVFGASDSIFAQCWVFHEIFMEGYARGFAETFEATFMSRFDQESVENLEPEALKQRELARRVTVLRYLLLYCTGLRFPEWVSLALEQAQRLDSPELLRAMLDKLLAACTPQDARKALTVNE